MVLLVTGILCRGAFLELCWWRRAATLGGSLILLLQVVVLGVTAGVGWWLSGFDSQLTWDGSKRDLVRRGLRCLVTLLVVEVALRGLIRWYLCNDRVGGWTYIALTVPLGVAWSGCLSELAARLQSRGMKPPRRLSSLWRSCWRTVISALR